MPYCYHQEPPSGTRLRHHCLVRCSRVPLHDVVGVHELERVLDAAQGHQVGEAGPAEGEDGARGHQVSQAEGLGRGVMGPESPRKGKLRISGSTCRLLPLPPMP